MKKFKGTQGQWSVKENYYINRRVSQLEELTGVELQELKL